MKHTERQDRGLQHGQKRFTRARIAGTIILVAAASVAIGGLREIYRSSAENYWEARFVRGDPVVVRFICGTDIVLDCNIPIRITYQKQDSKWCENLQSGDGGIGQTHWCNANPELGTISLYGALHSFDRFGVVTRAGHLVGQLFLH